MVFTYINQCNTHFFTVLKGRKGDVKERNACIFKTDKVCASMHVQCCVQLTGTADRADVTFTHVVFCGCVETMIALGTLGCLCAIALCLHV